MTFAHFHCLNADDFLFLSQFVLKHRPMWSLREAPYCVGTLNPHKEEGVRLVMEMLSQVVKLHPGLNTLHIGADEVNASHVFAVVVKGQTPNSLLTSSLAPRGVHPRRGGGVQTVVGLAWAYSGAAFPESCDQGGQGNQRGMASHDHHHVG